jgi:hypothetical protein
MAFENFLVALISLNVGVALAGAQSDYTPKPGSPSGKRFAMPRANSS